jgi:hypothetical protein
MLVTGWDGPGKRTEDPRESRQKETTAFEAHACPFCRSRI